MRLESIEKTALGEVFRGVAAAEGKEAPPLLVQVLPGDLGGDLDAGRLAARRRVAGPHLPATVAVEASGGEIRVAYPYGPGRSLAAVLRRAEESGRGFAPEQALLAAKMMARALSRAALEKDTRGPVRHGFVVPELIWITDAGDLQVLGLAVAPALAASPAVAAPDFARYLSPERRRGEEADASDDVYSLAVLLWDLLLGAAGGSGGDSELWRTDSSLVDLVSAALGPREARPRDAAAWGDALDRVFPQQPEPSAERTLRPTLGELFHDELPTAAGVPRALVRKCVASKAEAAERPAGSAGRRWGLGLAAAAAVIVVSTALWVWAGPGSGDRKLSEPPTVATSRDLPLPMSEPAGDPVPAPEPVPATESQEVVASDAAPEPDRSEALALAGTEETAAPEPLPVPEPPEPPQASLPSEVERPRASRTPAREAAEPQVAERVVPEPAPRRVQRPTPPPASSSSARSSPLGEPDGTVAARPPAPRRRLAEPPAGDSLPSAPSRSVGAAAGAAPPPEVAPEEQAEGPRLDLPSVWVGDLVEPGPGVTPPSAVRLPSTRAGRGAAAVGERVEVRLLVDHRGEVVEAKPASRGANGEIAEALSRAAAKARFEPATKEGVAVKMWITLTYTLGEDGRWEAEVR